MKTWLDAWPVFRQLTGPDPLGRGAAARSKATENVVSRTATADRVVQSVCPYCAVGCAQNVYVKDEKIVQIEGNPDSPVNRGRLCPKGSASKSLVMGLWVGSSRSRNASAFPSAGPIQIGRTRSPPASLRRTTR